MKTFKQMYQEMMTAADAGIPQDTSNIGPPKKRKRRPLTRRYIEVNGKIKRLMK